MYQAKDFTKVFHFIQSKTLDDTLPVSVFGVAQADGIVELRAFGRNSSGTAVREDDIFPIFSITKPMIGLCIAQLWERGLINIEAPVSQYIPEWKASHNEVKVWHLMSHVSGVNQSYLNDYLSGLHSSVTHEELLQSVMNSELTDRPGTVLEYNNLGFTVLAEIIIRISGMPYDQYLKKNLLQPLHMDDTGFDMPSVYPERIVEIVADSQFLSKFDSYVEAKFPAGGLFSTASDLLRLGRCCLNCGGLDGASVVSPLTFQAMLEPQTRGLASKCESGVTYGLTWKRPVERRGLICKNIYGHNGMGGCMLWVYPDQEVTFVLMTNKINLPFDSIAIHNVFSSCL